MEILQKIENHIDAIKYARNVLLIWPNAKIKSKWLVNKKLK